MDKSTAAKENLAQMLSQNCSVEDISAFLVRTLNDQNGLVLNRTLLQDFIQFYHASSHPEKPYVWQSALDILAHRQVAFEAEISQIRVPLITKLI